MAKQKSKIIYHDDVEQGSPEWLQLRENKFTGSNAYKLLTSFGAGVWSMSKDTGFKGNQYTERGHLLEGEAIELYEKINDCKVEHTGFVTNEAYEDCLYSPDGFLRDRTLEVKSFNPKKHLECIKSVPVTILAQCHFGQMIMDKPLTDLIFYCPMPTNWDEEKNGKWPVPVDKMLFVVKVKRDRDIQNNFKVRLDEYHAKKRKV